MAAEGFVISDTTYAGEAAAQFVLPAITGADTLDGGHAYLKDGIKKKFTIPRWNADYTNLVQSRKATPTSVGSMEVDAQYITPEDYMIYMEFNPRDFETHWYSQEMAPGLIDAQLPYNANSVVVMGVMQRHAKYFNNAIWNSSIGAPPAVQNSNGDFIFGFFNGWLQKLYQGIVTAFPANYIGSGTLNATNIEGVLVSCYEAIPLALRYDPNMKFFCSYTTFDLWRQWQVNQTYKGIDATKEANDEFAGRKLVKIADFPDNTIVVAKGMATTDSAMWVGINSISDEGLKFAPLQNNSELWFVKLLMKADVNFAWYQECVYYGPAVN
jgi:hypothetical protein